MPFQGTSIYLFILFIYLFTTHTYIHTVKIPKTMASGQSTHDVSLKMTVRTSEGNGILGHLTNGWTKVLKCTTAARSCYSDLAKILLAYLIDGKKWSSQPSSSFKTQTCGGRS